MVVAVITTCAVSAHRHESYMYEFEPRSLRGVLDTSLFYVIKFVSDL
jgi:hypothetical protein